MLQRLRLSFEMVGVCLRGRFESAFYGNFYEDLRGLPSRALVAHYVRHGRAEGRFANAADAMAARARASAPLPEDFDPQAYGRLNRDVASACHYDWQLALHYLDYGRRQGRAYRDAADSARPLRARTTIYAARSDGLGTRLLTIIYAKILADRCGFDFRVLWPPLLAPHYDDARLLDPRGLGELFASNQVFTAEAQNPGEFALDGLAAGARAMRIVVRDPGLAWDERRFDLLAETYDALIVEEPYPFEALARNAGAPDAEVKRLWDCIGWNDDISGFIRAFHTSWPPGGYVAAHVRRGDIVAMLLEAEIEDLANGGMDLILQRYVAISDVCAAIVGLGAGLPVLVCSDDPDLRSAFEAAGVPARFSRDLFTGTASQRAAADLLMLSRARYVVAPQLSFFSKCAETVGDCVRLPLAPATPATIAELLASLEVCDDARRRAVTALIEDHAARRAKASGASA